MTNRALDELAANDQVEDLLEAYAHGRLTPSGPILSRMRAQVLAEAAARAAATSAERLAAELDRERGRRWQIATFGLARRVAALGVAATLALGTGAAVLAAPPGSPLYDARVAIEAALLPTSLDARLASHEEHLADRLAEAEAAAARGDSVGLMAALAAYQAEVDAAVLDAGNDADLLAHLEAVLGKHLAVLTALEARLPDQAAIDKALERSQKAVERIKDRRAPAGRPSSTPARDNR